VKNFCRFRDQNFHGFWDQLRKNIPRYDPDVSNTNTNNDNDNDDDDDNEMIMIMIMIMIMK